MSAKKYFFILFFLLLALNGFSQPFQKVYNLGYGSDFLILPGQNGFVITGNLETNTNDRLSLLRIDSVGNRLFGKSYRDIVEFYSRGNIIRPAGNGWFLFGMSFNDTISNQEISFTKVDSLGNLIWSKRIGNAYEDDDVLDVLEISQQHFLLTGYSAGYGAGQEDVLLINADSSGNVIWAETLGSAFEEIGKVTLANGNGFIVFCEAEDSVTHTFDICILQLDSSGQLLNEKKIPIGGSETINKVIRSADGGFLITGHSSGISSDTTNLLAIKTDSLLNVEWSGWLGGIPSTAYDVLQMSNDHFLIGGMAYSNLNNGNAFLVELDESGNLSGTVLFGDSSTANFNRIQLENDSTLLTLGYFIIAPEIIPRFCFMRHQLGTNDHCDQFNGSFTWNQFNAVAVNFTLLRLPVTDNFIRSTVVASNVVVADLIVCDLLSTTSGPVFQSEVRVFPNPVVHDISIEAALPVSGFSIFDTQGRLVFTSTESRSTISLASGCYILIVYSGELELMRNKLMVQ